MTEIIISGIFSLLGTFAGIFASGKLTTYRIEQLEKKVDKHNNLIERMFRVEEHLSVIDEKIKVVNNRINDLEAK